MSGTADRLDTTMMIAMHDALRRELERLARITARTDDDPSHILRTAVGWEMFKAYLHVHHTTEDDVAWPVMYAALADRPSELALLDAMEAEHAAIDPLLAAVDEALADRESGPQRLGGLVDALAGGLTGHLRHEEAETLPLIDATMTQEQWTRFGKEHGSRIGAEAPRYLPWLLDGASDETVAAVLGRFIPPPLAAAYESEWRTAYLRRGLWVPRDEPAAI